MMISDGLKKNTVKDYENKLFKMYDKVIDNNVKDVWAATFGDDGNETNIAFALPQLAIFSEYCFKGKECTKEWIGLISKFIFGIDTKDLYAMSWTMALTIGLFQMVALWPGFSRSLATIMGGVCVGLGLIQAIRFSFLLGLLTSLVATGYKFLKNGSEIFMLMDGSTCFLGILVAFLIGTSTIYSFFKYLEKNGLSIFGYYRIFIGILLLVF